MRITGPRKLHTLLEARALLELGLNTFCIPWLMKVPKGEHHPVMILPGFLASDASTVLLRKFLSSKGYATTGWNLGRNLGQHVHNREQVVSDALLNEVEKLKALHNKKVTLIGWSLGGIMAREIARIIPDSTKAIITLGSPFGNPDHAAPMASKLFKRINKKRMGNDFSIPDSLNEPIQVPSTYIYSRSDGIAHWRACRHHHKEHNPLSENIEVRCSHLGYGHHPGVLWLLGHRLASHGEEWKPMCRSKIPSWLFPHPDR